jgi:hypothetical protein
MQTMMQSMNCTHKSVFHLRMASLTLIALAVLLTLGLPAARAQQEDEQKGVDQGNYNIKQSIEFGGRITSVGGNFQTYDTFVNLQQGPRLLGFTMEMRSLDHHGTLFDSFYFDNFGYGGDPNMASRLRISKNKWYSFNALFRKDENFWDYSLQANPLNPTTSFVNGPAGYGGAACTSCVLAESPHAFNTRRKLGDYNLLLLPQSRIRLRVGYSRNTVDGPVLSSIHEGTEQALFEDYSTTVNTYRVGVDFKVLPRTNISYDEIWNYYKGDTGTTDQNQNPLFVLANGTPVDLGYSLNAGASQPCAGTFLATGFVNPTCNAFLSYGSHARTRTNTPTEQISLQSNYWKNWDFSARASYSAGDMNVFGYDQTILGQARGNVRNDQLSGPIEGRRVAATADFGATWHITPKLNFVNSFHFENWHNPAQFLSSECTFFSANMLTPANVFTPTATVPVACTAPSDGVAGLPVHSSSSGADVSQILNSNFLKQDEKTNLAELEYQFNSKMGARLGFRFRHRAIADNAYSTTGDVFFPGPTAALAARGSCALVNAKAPVSQANLPAGCTLNPDGSITFLVPASTPAPPDLTFINEYAGLFGLWFRPTANWKISFDTELMSADNAFTRVSPRETQEYRVRSKYKVTNWLNLNGSINIWEGRNNVFEVNNLQHNRAYGVSAILQPTDKVGFEVGYDYNDVYSQILICITSSAVPAGPTTIGCTGLPGLLQELSVYTNTSSYGYFDATWTPMRRLTARLGANLTGTNGSALITITPNAPTGPLDSLYLQPFGGFDYHFAKGWTGKAYWGYYDYREDSSNVFQDIFAPRNFRANLITLSLKYAF